MLSLRLILAAAALMAASGLPSILLPRRSPWGQRVAALAMAAAGALGLAALALAGTFAASGGSGFASLSLAWRLPWGNFAVALDPLSAVFLALVFVVPPLGSIYGLGYWKQAEKPRSAPRLQIAYGFLAGAMALVLVARDGALFLVSWEIMALAAFFAATASDEGPALRRAGWVYLVATHAGTLCLFAMFAIWNQATGSLALSPSALIPAPAADALFVLALAGFGFKAGLAPLHFWLPDAHANAPSHVSATMSGVMLKMGLYGILRMGELLPTPPAWRGWTLLGLGALSALAGIVLAIGQRDIKRVLAYSSVENLGIAAMGAGLALLGAASGSPILVALGLGGALLHAWNHGLFKSLLFLGSGALAHAAGSRDIERMGGLAKKLPLLAALFLLGSAAISALPPLNGFAGELLLYLGFLEPLLHAEGTVQAVAVAAIVLAMVGALALACFVRLYGTVFLGAARDREVALRVDAVKAAGHWGGLGPAMLAPMILLALGCAFIGLFPASVLPAIQAAAVSWAGTSPATTMSGEALPALASAAPFGAISAIGLALVAAVAALLALPRLARRKAASGPTWDCGYASPTARMQYTASSFGDTIARLFAGRALRRREPRLGGPVAADPAGAAFFPAPSRLEAELPDPVLDRAVLPAASRIGGLLPRFKFFQTGETQLYVLYVLLIAIILFAFGGTGARP
jgi:hydrogenase-4 component B